MEEASELEKRLQAERDRHIDTIIKLANLHHQIDWTASCWIERLKFLFTGRLSRPTGGYMRSPKFHETDD